MLPFQIRSGPLGKCRRTILKPAFWHFCVTFPPRFEGRRVVSAVCFFVFILDNAPALRAGKKNSAKFSSIFNEKNEIRERCKGVHCVDLGESFPTSIYLQKSRRYSRERALRSLGGKFNSIFTSLRRWRASPPRAPRSGPW